MIKSFPILSAAIAVGLFCLSMVASHAEQPKRPGSRKATAATSPTPAPLASPAASTATNAAGTNVEAPPTDETKPDATNPQAAETEILASQGANFASKDRIAVFTGDVRVNDPRFQLACDKLTVYLAKGAMGDAGGAAPTPAATDTPAPLAAGSTPAGAKAKDPANPGGGIDHAIAEGHVIIIQKRPPSKPGEEPKLSIGRGDRGEFDNKSGDMTLRGTPSVEQNGNTHVALAQSTVMILHKDNSMETHGPSRTMIMQRKGGTGFEAPGGSPAGNGTKPAGGAPPAGSPAGRRTQGGNT